METILEALALYKSFKTLKEEYLKDEQEVSLI